MKNKDYLTVRQEELMNFLWKVNEPLTANEMAERLAEDGWNNVTLFKTVQSLTTDGYLEVVGLEKTVKTYARKLAFRHAVLVVVLIIVLHIVGKCISVHFVNGLAYCHAIFFYRIVNQLTVVVTCGSGERCNKESSG